MTTELREEKRHRIRGEDKTGEEVAESITKAADKIEMKLWMKWSVTIVCALLTILGWFSVDFVSRLKADAEQGPKAMALIEPQRKELEEMRREQKRMVHNIDRMTIFFQDKWGMPREARSRRNSVDLEDN